jgi:glycosyltransferase involved in cell wall biosynthesis
MYARPLPADDSRPLKTTERVYDNIYWRGAAPRISICVPAYRHDVSALMEAIAGCASSGLAELIIYDDGSGDPDLLDRIEGHASYTLAAIRVVFAEKNRGRSAARNAATRHARADWILLLDADMLPDDTRFLERYFDTIDAMWEPSIVVGGYSLKASPRNRRVALHRWLFESSECVNAEARRGSPSRYVFASNVLLHRLVLDTAPFDESFAGWGWEGADWGLRAQNWFPVLHIDNTATHLGLDTDEALMGKHARSGANFLLLTRRHPQAARKMPLFRLAKRFKRLPFRKTLTTLTAATARLRILPLGLRGRALKMWRALIYAEAL